MLNFRFIIIVIILFFISNSYGQAPGYLGKRLFVEGNIGANLGLDFVSIGDDTKDYKFFRPNAKISANYVLNRFRYVAVEYGYQQFLNTQEPLLNFAGQPSLKYRISTQSLGIGFFRTSKKRIRSLAPIGFFLGYKFSFSRSTAIPVKYAMTNDKFGGVEKAAYNLNFERPELDFFGVAVSTGFRTVLKDRFTLSYAIDFGLDFPFNEFDSNEEAYAFTRSDLQRNKSLYMYFTIGGGILLN